MVVWLIKKGGYIFDRRFFLGCVGVLVLLFFIALAQIGTGRHFYMTCPADAIAPCRNPYYSNNGLGSFCLSDDEALCKLPHILLPGESFGEPPPWLIAQFPLITFCLVAAAFIGNHFVYNRRFRRWKK